MLMNYGANMDIYNVPKGKRYWVVRAESGTYYNHFVKYDVVCLGHLDVLNLPDTLDGKIFKPVEAELIDQFKSYHASKNNGKNHTSTHLAQIRSFIYEMKIGDWVLTVSDNEIRYGRIVGPALIKKTPLPIYTNVEATTSIDLTFHLRRKVSWGPSILKAAMPYGLMRSLKANQTLFSLDKNWEALHHTIYPAFTSDNRLYLSAKITTTDEIKNRHVSAIFTLLSEIEVIGKELPKLLEEKRSQSETGAKEQLFERLFDDYLNQNKLTITTKAQFNSPGDIWNTVYEYVTTTDFSTWSTQLVIAYSMLFGNSKLGFEGLIDIETRKKLWDILIERLRANKAEKVIESLKVKLPDYDTTALEDKSKDQENND